MDLIELNQDFYSWSKIELFNEVKNHYIKCRIIDKLTDKYITNIAITFHIAPDGDAIGSAVALALALRSLGKKVDILSTSYSSLFSPILHNVSIFRKTRKTYDLCILVDCSSRYRTIENIDDISKNLIVIDHHLRCKPIGNLYLCEDQVATAMIIYDIIHRMNIPITNQMATALYLGIFTDTNGLTTLNVNQRVFEVITKLSNKIDFKMINKICNIKSLATLKLLSIIFSRIIYDAEYRILYVTLMKEDLDNYKLTYDVVNLVMDELKDIDEAEIVFLFIESRNNTKIKARSKGNIAVNSIMNNFQGGGHKYSAGAVVESINIYQVVNDVIDYTKEYITAHQLIHSNADTQGSSGSNNLNFNEGEIMHDLYEMETQEEKEEKQQMIQYLNDLMDSYPHENMGDLLKQHNDKSDDVV